MKKSNTIIKEIKRISKISRTGIAMPKRAHIDQNPLPCPRHAIHNEHCLECFEHRAFIIEDIKREQLRKINPIRYQLGLNGMINNA